MDKRYKNVYFWIGLIGVIFSAAGVNLESLTSWNILFSNIMNILSNPFLLISVIMAVSGVIVDPTTKGFKDCELKLKQLEEKNKD